MAEFMTGLLDICFYLFDKIDNVIVIVPFVVLMFCFAFGLIRRMMRFL